MDGVCIGTRTNLRGVIIKSRVQKHLQIILEYYILIRTKECRVVNLCYVTRNTKNEYSRFFCVFL